MHWRWFHHIHVHSRWNPICISSSIKTWDKLNVELLRIHFLHYINCLNHMQALGMFVFHVHFKSFFGIRQCYRILMLINRLEEWSCLNSVVCTDRFLVTHRNTTILALSWNLLRQPYLLNCLNHQLMVWKWVKFLSEMVNNVRPTNQ